VSDLAIVRASPSAPAILDREAGLAIDWFTQRLLERAPVRRMHRVFLV
jgi:hypothetical protein